MTDDAKRDYAFVPGKPVEARSTALVLSGGGARGAYEAGVLSYLYGDFARVLGGRPSIDVLCGTSVGAINACHFAAHAAEPVLGVQRLVELWRGLELPRVIRVGFSQALQLPKVFLGGGDGAGLFDVTPLIELVEREVSWRAVARTIRRGHLRALAISATELTSGRTTVFIDAHPDVPVPTYLGARMQIVPGYIGPHHALASAAIPLLFPPVRIGPLLYCDGGLRQNTPIAPAIRLGAERVLVIGLSREPRSAERAESVTIPPATAPSAGFLLGKVLNAFLLDHVSHDIDLLQRLNDIIADGETAYGPEFVARMSEAATKRGDEAYRPVKALAVRPSEDIGQIACEHVRSGKFSGPLVARKLLSLLDAGISDEADLASYLLFDGAFAKKLIDLGRADAEAQRMQLAEFLGGT